MGETQEWATRPLDAVYVAVFIGAIVVKVRDGQVASRPVYAAIGVTAEGCKDLLGLWARHRRRGRQVLAERAHRPEEPHNQQWAGQEKPWPAHCFRSWTAATSGS